MKNIREITITNELDGSAEIHIIEEFAPGEFRSMPKAVWDELEAKREQSGTLS